MHAYDSTYVRMVCIAATLLLVACHALANSMMAPSYAMILRMQGCLHPVPLVMA